MTIRVGLMGFGRIGRSVFRQTEARSDMEVAAIVDIADPEALAYLLRFDTIHGRFDKPVEYADGHLDVAGRRIPMLADRDPGDVDWSALGVDIVVQATRKHRTAAECARHIERGAKRVILASTPLEAGDMDTIIMGANDDALGPESRMIALGSNTSNALAPVLKALDAEFGVTRAMYTVVHAFTNESRLADVPGDDLRTSRAAAENIIPAPTNSVEIIESVLPEFEGKLSGMALNVPVSDGSNVDMVAVLGRPTDRDEINAYMRKTADGSPIIDYTDQPIVSRDVVGDPHSAIWDGLATMVIEETMIKCITWFDNGWGYSARVIDAIAALASFDEEPSP
jgi:glyceraldehyde 3-phosphate dehydrogenase